MAYLEIYCSTVFYNKLKLFTHQYLLPINPLLHNVCVIKANIRHASLICLTLLHHQLNVLLKEQINQTNIYKLNNTIFP